MAKVNKVEWMCAELARRLVQSMLASDKATVKGAIYTTTGIYEVTMTYKKNTASKSENKSDWLQFDEAE